MKLNDLDAIIFDFDGVLTDDRVYVDQDGREMVCCNRRDGLGFDVLRRTSLKLFILSTERNLVVSRRGEKLQVPVYQGSGNKVESLSKMSQTHGFELNRALFVGNDLNDYDAMRACGFSVCPADSHPQICDIAGVVLKANGGAGVVRELVEDVLKLDMVSLFKKL